jgi:hypothetical protein
MRSENQFSTGTEGKLFWWVSITEVTCTTLQLDFPRTTEHHIAHWACQKGHLWCFFTKRTFSVEDKEMEKRCSVPSISWICARVFLFLNPSATPLRKGGQSLGRSSGHSTKPSHNNCPWCQVMEVEIFWANDSSGPNGLLFNCLIIDS